MKNSGKTLLFPLLAAAVIIISAAGVLLLSSILAGPAPPSIILPSETPDGIQTPNSNMPAIMNLSSNIRPIDVTPENLPGAIAAAERVKSYKVEGTFTIYSGDRKLEQPFVQWVAGETSKTVFGVSNGSDSGLCILLTPSRRYTYYSSSVTYYSAPRGNVTPDAIARIPSIRSLLTLTPDMIKNSGRITFCNRQCLLFEYHEENTGLNFTVYFSINDGLPVYMRTEKNGEAIASMVITSAEVSPDVTGVFLLPDGRSPT